MTHKLYNYFDINQVIYLSLLYHLIKVDLRTKNTLQVWIAEPALGLAIFENYRMTQHAYIPSWVADELAKP